MLIANHGGWDGRTGDPVDRPVRTITAHPAIGLATPPALQVKNSGGPGDTAWHTVADPLGTVNARDATGIACHPEIRAWLDQFTGGPRSINEPMATTLTRQQTGLAVTGWPTDIEVDDVFYRMLHPREIRAAMAFDPRFPLTGSKADQVRALGNAVTPPVAMWITERLVASLRPDKTHRL